jgi:hypothetical protein
VAFDDAWNTFLPPGTAPNVPPLQDCYQRLADLAGFDALKFDCCTNSCTCYAPDEYQSLEQCPYCSEPRRDAAGKSRKQYSTIPLVPILLALVEAGPTAKHMGYQSRFRPNPNKVSDVYDGDRYKSMCTTPVTINGHPLPHNFFSDHRDIALGLATDGFAPFKKRQVTAWPILLVNYNLPPSLRFRREYLICVGCIPGPNKPRDIDLFLWILVMELLRLAAGVKAFDGSGSGQQFILHTYLILCTGDMPAVAMLMRMLGHNAILACRMCNICGV